MLQIQDTIVSLDVITKEFCCDLRKCHGACCVEGDAGAPVTPDEIAQIEQLLPVISPMLSADALKAIEDKGIAYPDPEGELVTQIVNGKDCVFTCYDENGCCYCTIEKAYRELGPYWGLNYDRWDVCQAAVIKGHREHLPVYKCLKEPLIRRFGQEWYDELELTVTEMKKQNII